MARIVGVRFRNAGKIYYFDPMDFEIEMSNHVIVETARGLEMGTVLIPPRDVSDESVVQPLKPVVRIATDEDEANAKKNREKEKDALRLCKEKVLKHELDMKLVGAEYTFDGSKLLFYFTSDGRVDFRELVKDLAGVFRTRIELRQIGVRDETKIVGGLGICGRELCCKSYLADFVPVSIKMAKEQNLSLNPTKISGTCGRLMCCLKNEQETYEYLNRRMPSNNDLVTAKDGTKGTVASMNVLRQTVKVLVDNGDTKELREYSVDDITFKSRKKGAQVTAEEEAELAALTDGENISDRNTNNERQNKSNRGRNDRNSDNRDKNRDNQEKNHDEKRDGQNPNGEKKNDAGESNGEHKSRNRHRNRNRNRNKNRDNNGGNNGNANNAGNGAGKPEE